MRGEGLDRPDVGDDIDQSTADFCRTIGVGSMARCTVLTENRKGACGHQHEETKSHHKTPPNSGEND